MSSKKNSIISNPNWIYHVLQGSVISIALLVLSIAIASTLISKNAISMNHENIMVLTALGISSYAGAKTAVKRGEGKKHIICALSALTYIIFLFLVSIFVFGQTSNDLPTKSLYIILGAMSPLLHLKDRKRRPKHSKIQMRNG